MSKLPSMRPQTHAQDDQHPGQQVLLTTLLGAILLHRLDVHSLHNTFPDAEKLVFFFKRENKQQVPGKPEIETQTRNRPGDNLEG